MSNLGTTLHQLKPQYCSPSSSSCKSRNVLHNAAKFNCIWGLNVKLPCKHKYSAAWCQSRGMKVRAVGTIPESKPSEANKASAEEEEAPQPPCVNFAFVSSVLLPDGTPDVHLRTASGGQKLRDIMLDSNMELYGPYSRPLLNCAGVGCCGTCMVEVIEGKELLSPKTDIEKETLKKKPRNWRLACQTTVGEPDSAGLVVIQQLPEWKGHGWVYERQSSSESL